MSQIKNALLVGMILLTSAAFASQVSDRNVVVSDLDGNRLLHICSESEDSHSDFCSGFIVGARDGAVLATKLRDAKAILDVPVEVKQEQMLAVVVKYLNDHPEERHKQAALLVIFALSKAFPPQG
jgi:Rap1a immunity proteins